MISVCVSVFPFFIPSTSFCSLSSSRHPVHITSSHLRHHLRSHHISLPQSFTPDLKLISFTNPYLHSLPGSFWTAFTDLEPVPY